MPALKQYSTTNCWANLAVNSRHSASSVVSVESQAIRRQPERRAGGRGPRTGQAGPGPVRLGLDLGHFGRSSRYFYSCRRKQAPPVSCSFFGFNGVRNAQARLPSQVYVRGHAEFFKAPHQKSLRAD